MATFPFIFDSLLYVPNKCLVDKVKLFFKKTWSSDHDDDDDDDDDISYFHIPVQIDDIIIKVRLSEFGKSFWDMDQKFIMCFYDYHNITETLILICENLIQQFSEYKFDDILLLLVGIKDDTVPVKVDPNAKFKKLSVTDSKDSTGINSDIGTQLKKPNVRFAEWSVNSSDHDARKILQDFVRMVVIKGYFDTVRQLHEQSWFNQVEDRHMFSEDVPTQVTSWCLDSGSLFPVVTLRCLELIRIAISYKTVDLFCTETIEFSRTVPSTLIWKNIFDWSQLQLNTTTDDKLFHFDLDNHTFQMPASSANQPISIFVNDIGSAPVILKSQEAETFGRSLVMTKNSSGNLKKLILQFKSLHHLVIDGTIIDVTNLAFPSQLCETLKHLVMVDCCLTEVPQAVGSLTRLTLLNISENFIETLPACLGNLRELRTFLYEDCPIKSPPKNVLTKSAREVVLYLRAFQDDKEKVPYKRAKLIVAGQKDAGKSTLIKGMKRKVWTTNLNPAPETYGVEIITLQLEGTRFHVYDLAGDVEYLNTHPLFMSSECLHLVVFDLSLIPVGKGSRSPD